MKVVHSNSNIIYVLIMNQLDNDLSLFNKNVEQQNWQKKPSDVPKFLERELNK